MQKMENKDRMTKTQNVNIHYMNKNEETEQGKMISQIGK